MMFNRGVTDMSSIYADSGYKFVVEFEKVLTKGVLNGLTIKDKVRFVTEKDARNWVYDVSKFDKGASYKHFKIMKAVA